MGEIMIRNKEPRRDLTDKECEKIAVIMNRRRMADVALLVNCTERNLATAWRTKKMTPTMIAILLSADLDDIQKTTKKKRTIRQESRPVVLPRGCFA